MKRMKSVLALLLALLMVFSLCACGEKADKPAASTGDEPTSGTKKLDVLNLGIYGDNTFTGTFDPSGAVAGTGAGYGVIFTMYDTPFYINSEGKYVSRIITKEEWTDSTTLVLQLRDGIKFTNGEQLVGEDILFSLGLMQNSGMRSGYYTPFDLANSTVSDDGLTITLKTYEPYAAYYAGLDFAILDKTHVESCGGIEAIDWYDPKAVVGSGPYTCTAFESGASATYVKRDDYWGLECGYDDIYGTINVTKYADQSTMSIDLETGAIDVAIDMSVQDFDRLAAETSDNIETALIDCNVVYQLVFDLNNNEYLKDAKVREALCYAVNTADLTAAVAGTFGEAADSMFGRKEIGYLGGTAYEYNPEKAKELLTEAGYSDGELNFKIAVIGSEPYTTICEILQGYFNAVGVGLEIESLEMAAFISNAQTPGFCDFQIYTMTGGNPYGEPVVHLDNWYSNSTSPIMKRTEEYDALLIKGETSLDNADRVDAYNKLQQLWHDNFDGVPLYEFKKGYAYNTDVFESFKLASTSVVWIFDAVIK